MISTTSYSYMNEVYGEHHIKFGPNAQFGLFDLCQDSLEN